MPVRRPRRRLRNALALVSLAIVGWLAWEAWTWPDVGALARRPPATTAFIERWRAAQREAGRSDRADRRWVGYGAISPSLKVAVLVAEDINFFSHRGFDGGEIRKALTQALEERELPRGASTITQQLAKNLWLSPSRDPLRKTREAALTWQLERALGKRRLLEIYLSEPAQPGRLAPGGEQRGISPPRRPRAAADGQGPVPQEADLMATPIFRDYDQKALDAEYNNRVKVKNAMDWMARAGAESARARAELPLRFDVPYGDHHAERLDVFPAARPGPAPVHVFVHGGYWQRMDKADFSFVARGLRPAGAVTVVVNYGLVPAIDLDELVRQCRAALAWVHRHAREWGGDPDRISVSGHSAGGHLVAMLLATDWAAFDAPGDVVKAGCAISGLYDLEPIRLCYLNDVLNLTPEVARRNSPVHLTPSRPTPLILALGGTEGVEYHRQTDDLASAWRARGVSIEVLDLAGHDHFSIVAELESPFSPLARAIQGQLGLV